jgi:hypothetical protein
VLPFPERLMSFARGFRVVCGLVRTAGRPVVARAGATFVAVLLPSTILFGPQGMRARDLTRAMHESPVLRAVVWVGWLLLAAPAARIVFHAPGTTQLRSLRLPRPALLVGLLLLASVVQIPWAILHARGSGPLEAFGAVALAMTIEAAAIAGARRRASLILLGLGVSIALRDPSPVAGAALGAALAPVAIDAAWRTALEQRASARIWTRPSTALRALTTVHLLKLAREGAHRFFMAMLVASLGGAGLLTLRSDPTERPLQRALAVMALPLVVVLTMFVGPLIDCERSIEGTLRSLRVHRLTVVAAFFLTLATPTSALAAAAGVGACVVGQLDKPFLITGGLLVWALGLTCAVGTWSRRHSRTKERSAAVFAIGAVVVAVLAVAIPMAVVPW